MRGRLSQEVAAIYDKTDVSLFRKQKIEWERKVILQAKQLVCIYRTCVQIFHTPEVFLFVKEPLSVLVHCAPVFIFTSGSSALLGVYRSDCRYLPY